LIAHVPFADDKRSKPVLKHEDVYLDPPGVEYLYPSQRVKEQVSSLQNKSVNSFSFKLSGCVIERIHNILHILFFFHD